MTMWQRSWRVWLIPAMVVSATLCVAGQAHAQAQFGAPHVMMPRDAGATTATSGVSNLIDHGGPVLANSTTYAIWWGDPSAFPADAQARITSFLQGLEGSDYLAIATQYMRGAAAHTHFGGNFYVPNSLAPPAQFVNGRQIGSEIGAALCSFFDATKQTPDPSGVYFVFTSNFPKSAPFCAFHGYGECGNTANLPVLKVAYVPNTTDVWACDATNVEPFFEPNSDSEGTQAMINLAAHEFMETITDPLFSGWYDSGVPADEIGDKCTWLFHSAVPLTDGSRRKVQAEWSNQVGGCDQGAGFKVQLQGAVSKAGNLATFSSPGANYGTFGLAINQSDAVVGNLLVDDFSNFGLIGNRAFLRDASGVLTTFDGPGATDFTFAHGINSAGTITGDFYDAAGPGHGFARNSNGTFTTFDVSTSAGTLSTAGYSINDQGVIAGHYQDASGLYHGLVRDPSGTITTFDAPGSIGTTTTGTRSYSINGAGTIAGYYSDVNGVNHGFARDPYGNITSFDAPGTGTAAGQGTIAQSINGLGAIAGYYLDANNVNHGFVQDPHGIITTFDAPGATFGTFVYSINGAGAVAGYYSDSNGLPHAFVRDASGNFSTPSALGASYGSVARSINDQGAITGYVTEPVK